MASLREKQVTTYRPVPVWRFAAVCLVASVLATALCWRLLSLQVVDKAFLQQQGDARTLRTEQIEANRGMILDRHGEPLAISTPVATIWANPKQIDLAHPALPELAKVLDMRLKELIAKLSDNREKEFIYLRRKVEPHDAQRIRELHITGINARQEYKRFYPAADVAAHYVGFVNIDEMGQEGVELAYDDMLRGEPGFKRVMQDSRGQTFREVNLIRDAEPGKDVRLSVDLRLQYLASRELKAAVDAHQAKAGSLVMLDVATGEVLAMVNHPTFNPNNRRHLQPAALRNRVLTDVFEPGSTVKPLTISAALASGRYSPGTLINTSPGWFRVGRKTIRDHSDYGVLDLTGVIAKSSNVATTKIAMDLTGEVVRNVFAQFGLGQAMSLGFPGETVGVLPAPVKWRPIEVATLSYGYGLSVNAMQLAQAYATLASGGVRHPVSLLKLDKAPIGERVVSERVAGQVREMMRAVVEKGGTGTRAQTPFYDVAGKTGTVHVVGANGYEASEYKALFAGFAPVANPRIAVVVVIDRPNANAYYGGEVAAPVFGRVVGESLRLLNVTPDILPVATQAPAHNETSGGRNG